MAQRVKRPAEAWWYVLKDDRELPLDEQSRFLLRPLTGAERAGVWDDYVTTKRLADDSTVVQKHDFVQSRELVLTHVERIDNFPAGEPVAWPESPEARARYLEMMDDFHVRELGNEIRERSSLEPAMPAPKERPTPEEEATDAKNS